MMRHETLFVIHDDLIVVRAVLEVVDNLGYTPRDGLRRTRVRTAVGSEHGYVLGVAEISVFGISAPAFPVHVFDLGHDDIDGLLGMNFLSLLNYDVRSNERRILVERATERT